MQGRAVQHGGRLGVAWTLEGRGVTVGRYTIQSRARRLGRGGRGSPRLKGFKGEGGQVRRQDSPVTPVVVEGERRESKALSSRGREGGRRIGWVREAGRPRLKPPPREGRGGGRTVIHPSRNGLGGGGGIGTRLQFESKVGGKAYTRPPPRASGFSRGPWPADPVRAKALCVSTDKLEV